MFPGELTNMYAETDNNEVGEISEPNQFNPNASTGLAVIVPCKGEHTIQTGEHSRLSLRNANM